MTSHPIKHKPGFHGIPIHCATRDGRNFRWLKTFGYMGRDGHWHEIPAHDDSDGASTPRLIWFFIPPFGKYFIPAALHDHLYRRTKLEKAKCDLLFLEAMESAGVSWLMRHLIYWGVKWFGGPSFGADRRR